MTGFNVKQLTVTTADGLNFTLVVAFTFTRPNGDVITILPGAVSDGASVPRAMWRLLPPFGTYWMAAFLHDDLYRNSCLSKEDCDTIFDEAMTWLKVGPLDRTALYEGVEHGGGLSFLEDRAIRESIINKQPIKEPSMFAKIAAFFASFFHNAKTDPVNTVKGIVQVAAAGGVAYAMTTGVVPLQAGIPLVSTLAVSGLHAIGTDTTTKTVTPAAQQVIDTITAANQIAPDTLDIVEQLKAARDDASKAQDKVLAYSQLAAALAATLPQPVVQLVTPAPQPVEVPVELPVAPLAVQPA